MATNNNRLKRTTVTGVVNTGNGNSRLDTTQAERKAAEALAKAKEALDILDSLNITGVASLADNIKKVKEDITNLTEKLEALESSQNNSITIESVILSEAEMDSLWNGTL